MSGMSAGCQEGMEDVRKFRRTDLVHREHRLHLGHVDLDGAEVLGAVQGVGAGLGTACYKMESAETLTDYFPH